MSGVKQQVITFQTRINRVNQAVVGILMMLLILDVWVGVLDRYVFQWQLVWVEELARYIMIWAILLAVPCCTAGREHMGLKFLVNAFPMRAQQIITVVVSLITVAFFAYVAWLGIAFAEKGVKQLSTVFALPMFWAYLAIPATFTVSAFQAFLVLIIDVCDLLSPQVELASDGEAL